MSAELSHSLSETITLDGYAATHRAGREMKTDVLLLCALALKDTTAPLHLERCPVQSIRHPYLNETSWPH
jgi:hypothetical protein